MVKRRLTQIADSLAPASLRAIGIRGGISLPSRDPRTTLDTLEAIPSTAPFSAQEARDRLRETVEGFFS